MAIMVGLVIKNLSPELHRKLKERARRHHRSMTKEAVAILEQALEGPASVREPPPPYKGSFELTDDFLDQAKREGRE